MTVMIDGAAANAGSGRNWLLLLLKARTFVALLLVFAFFSVMAPNFLSAANAILISKHVAINAFLAIGMTFVIITGGIDLSVGSVVGLTSMIAGYLVLNGIDLGIGYSLQFNTLEIVAIVCLAGALVGCVNGILITRLNVAPFIATLGMLYVARGAALLFSDGADLSQSQRQSGLRLRYVLLDRHRDLPRSSGDGVDACHGLAGCRLYCQPDAAGPADLCDRRQ
jgi:erythritol transport system permease protein